MACSKCGKRSGKGSLKRTSETTYDFAADKNFILVRSVSKYMKKLRSYALSSEDLRKKYNIRSYGVVAKNVELYMLETDFDYYRTHKVSGVELVKVESEVVEPEVVEPEVIQKIVVPEDTHDDLTLVKGIGKATAEKLALVGYQTIEKLVTIPYEEWAECASMPNEDSYNAMLQDAAQILS